jgi:hypothetical protein
MINKLKYATIADIGVYDLIFYDKSKEQELIDFCKVNGISFLPSKNRKEVYKWVKDGFERQPLTIELCIKPYERIFNLETLERFNSFNYNEIHFIVENNLIKGVVHIIDYNSEFIQVELYRALFKFEIHLRDLLVKKKITNEDFIHWVKFKAENEKDNNSRNHWRKRYDEINPSDPKKFQKVLSKRKEFKPFQTFYLLELLRFASDKKVIDKSKIDMNKISKLRNQVAHSNNPTTYTKEEGQLVYNYTNLKTYVEEINAFFRAYEYLLLEVDYEEN